MKNLNVNDLIDTVEHFDPEYSGQKSDFLNKVPRDLSILEKLKRNEKPTGNIKYSGKFILETRVDKYSQVDSPIIITNNDYNINTNSFCVLYYF